MIVYCFAKFSFGSSANAQILDLESIRCLPILTRRAVIGSGRIWFCFHFLNIDERVSHTASLRIH